MSLIVLTDEQDEIVECGARNLVVNAFAGSGKTTALVAYARARPHLRMLYLAFNKGIQLEAEKKFPKNVECRTTHSIAYRVTGVRYKHKLTNGLRAMDLAQFLHTDMVTAQYALETISLYCCSADYEMSGAHLPAKIPDGRDTRLILSCAERFWEAMRNPSVASAGMTHDGYLKLFQLTDPQLSKYDVILFDEGQDANPVTTDIVLCQSCDKVLVGDDYQAIYAFRGAINALREFPADERLCLTKSFRFGQGIATLASGLLKCFFGETKEISGLGPVETRFEVDYRQPFAILCRTNAGIFDAAVGQLDKRAFGFVGGVDSYQFENILDAYRLFAREHSLIRNPMIKAFESFSDMEVYATTVDDREIKSLVRVVASYGSRIPGLVERIRREAIQDLSAVVAVLSTAHKSKGLEFTQVKLLNDFGDILDPDTGRPMEIKSREEQEEIHLLYVSLTRAREAIELNHTLIDWLRAVKNEMLLPGLPLTALEATPPPPSPIVPPPTASVEKIEIAVPADLADWLEVLAVETGAPVPDVIIGVLEEYRALLGSSSLPKKAA